MTKQAVVNILTEVRKLKEKSGLTIVDSHIHPLDVMWVVHYSETRSDCPDQDYLQPGILEKFNYNKIEKLGSRAYFKLHPRGVEGIIEKTYQHVNVDRMIKEMEASLTDKGVLLSLDPWAPTETVGKKYSHDSRFLILGSIVLYNRIAYNIAFLYNAVMGSGVYETWETSLVNILGRNFYNYILK